MSEIKLNYTITHLSNRVDEEKIKSFEESIGYSLPEDYKLFLEQHNYCTVFPNTFEAKSLISEEQVVLDLRYLCGLKLKRNILHACLEFKLEVFSNRIPGGLIAIGGVTGGLLLLGVSSKYYNKIFFWDREFEFYDEYDPGTVDEHVSNLYFVSNSFNDFLSLLYEDDEDEEE
tara:strand:+ start:177 stop:695 length:519 start_codon:yes stop_codon:yes gene_type:complete